MTIKFYVNNKGEVLSNTQWPVTGPKLVMPVLTKHPSFLEVGNYGEWGPDFHTELYQAVTVIVPDE